MLFLLPPTPLLAMVQFINEISEFLLTYPISDFPAIQSETPSISGVGMWITRGSTRVSNFRIHLLNVGQLQTNRFYFYDSGLVNQDFRPRIVTPIFAKGKYSLISKNKLVFPSFVVLYFWEDEPMLLAEFEGYKDFSPNLSFAAKSSRTLDWNWK